MDINKEISRIKDIVMDLYKNLFSSSENYINDFLSFRIPIEKQYLEKINILDCTSDKLKNIIQKYGIVSLSPFYDTQRVRELSEYFNRKEKSYKEEKEREKDELNSLLIEEKKKNEELSKQINKLKNENSDLENRANRMESDIQNLNNFISNDISNIWHKQLGKALKEIHDCIKDIDIQKNHIPKKHISPKTILLLIGFAFILGVILLCIFLI